jgi:flagellar motor switch protein FliN/FliY
VKESKVAQKSSAAYQAEVNEITEAVGPLEHAKILAAQRNDAASLGRVLNVDLELRVELGRVSLPIREILELSAGSIVDLKTAVGEPAEVFVNNRPLAKCEIVVVDDVLGIRITEILDSKTGEAAALGV